MTTHCRSGFARASTIVLLLTLAPVYAASADEGKGQLVAPPANEWRQWRGPYFNGASDAKNLPAKFDAETNVAWKTAMPGPSSGTPVIAGDRVFVSALDKTSKKLLAMCVSRADGKILWSKEVGDGFQQNQRNNMASPSPITDGTHVWFHYGTGDLAAFDLEGNPKWARNIAKDHGAFNYQWIYGSSPTLYDGRLYVQVLHRDVPVGRGGGGARQAGPAPSYLLAIDPTTGKDLWKHVRPEQAAQESKESYGTPVPFEHNGQKMLLLIGGDVVTAHDAATGKEIWRCGGWNPEKVGHWRVVPSVVVAGGLVITCTPKNGPVFAIKPDGTGDVTNSHVAWNTREFTSDVCIPLYYDGKLYVLNGDGPKTLYRVDPATGKVESSVKLGGDDVFRASPTGGDGKIYCMNEGGQVWVVDASGDQLKTLAEQVDLGGGSSTATRASVALADNQIFVRTADTLYCIGGK